MDSDVLTAEAEKVKELAISKGLLLPNFAEIDPNVEREDYNLSIIDIANKFEGIHTLIQDIRARKFKYDNLTSWNPFQFEYQYGCKPFFTKNIENFGFDPNTSNCKCPENYSPCTLNHAISDISNWSNSILEDTTDTPVEDLSIVIDELKKINIYGKSITEDELTGLDESEADSSSKDEFCKSSDVILCSSKGFVTQTTQWSDWSGCSTKCGPGIQERFRINYNGNNYKLLKESRACELSKCTNKYISDSVKCFVTITKSLKPDQNTQLNEQSGVLYQISECGCDEGERLCTSDEASRTMNSWISTFRRYCDSELTKNQDSKILQRDIMGNDKEIFGKGLKIEFSDGFYFDCAENWGISGENDLHMYCKTDSPVLCTRTTPIDYPDSSISLAEVHSDLRMNYYAGFILVGSLVILLMILIKNFIKKTRK